jgi:hypothetical protein
MNRTGLWLTLALLLAGLTVFGISSLVAQRPPPLPGMGGFNAPEIGRYQVVRATDDEVIVLDTATGDLYRAKTKDIKPYSERPKPDTGKRDPVIPALPKDTLKDLPAPPKDFPIPRDRPSLPPRDKEKASDRDKGSEEKP